MAYWHPDDGASTKVCIDCIGDSFLREEVRQNAEEGTCSYCEGEDRVISLRDLAGRIREVLNAQFYMTSSEPEGLDYYLAKEGRWNRAGDDVAQVISDMAGLDDEISEEIRAYLSGRYGYRAVKDGEEDPFGHQALYEEQGPDVYNFKDTWDSFCQRIKWRSRFFSEYAEMDLNSIFGDLDSLKTIRDVPVVRVISPTDEDRFVYRARVAFTQSELEHILKYPAHELGAPPARLARAGRMNAVGISVFYGAESADTCLAEIRAPVGSSVVVGRFEIILPVRLLDMDALPDVYIRGSHFDPDFATQRARAAFLGHLVQTISRPVMPNDETFDYLPTQVIAEYLATKVRPPFDGVIFGSSQTGGKGRNIVLFNHASAAEPDDIPPGMRTTLWIRDDEEDASITVFEEIWPPTSSESPKTRDVFGISVPLDEPMEPPPAEDDATWLNHREPTLKLDIKSVDAVKVTGIRFNYDRRPVYRSRFNKKDTDESLP